MEDFQDAIAEFLLRCQQCWLREDNSYRTCSGDKVWKRRGPRKMLMKAGIDLLRKTP